MKNTTTILQMFLGLICSALAQQSEYYYYYNGDRIDLEVSL